MICNACCNFLFEPGQGYNVQFQLMKAQTTPCIGPILISPLTALASVIEIIVGLAGVILCGALALCCCSVFQIGVALGEYHCIVGFTGLKYSLFNIFTLGLKGQQLVNSFRKEFQSATEGSTRQYDYN